MKRFFFLLAFLVSLHQLQGQGRAFTTQDYVRGLKEATDVMITDVTSPVAASRYYAYINLAASEVAGLFGQQPFHFGSLLKGFTGINADNNLVKKSDPSFATVLALYKSSIRLLPSGYLLNRCLDSLKQVAEMKKISSQKIRASFELVDSVIKQVIRYVGSDGFAKLSGMKRFTPQRGDAYWQPTAPGFMSAIEPNWHTLRTFFLDSCSQFSSPPPLPYSSDTTSQFYHSLVEVYQVGRNLSKEQAAIANFWDCNPFALQQLGHLEFGIKKISPGGHWMGITGIACQQQKLSLSTTAYIHALVAATLADAFISCWNDKYRYNRVRPVTAIKRLIDRDWNPLLQTPPFPEYTSGHSVISTAAATVLSYVFGDAFAFTDTTEKEFGLPERKFLSFRQAAEEAAVSRLYGGIHFRDAIENGVREGEQVARFILQRVMQNKPVPDLLSIRTINRHP